MGYKFHMAEKFVVLRNMRVIAWPVCKVCGTVVEDLELVVAPGEYHYIVRCHGRVQKLVLVLDAPREFPAAFKRGLTQSRLSKPALQ